MSSSPPSAERSLERFLALGFRAIQAELPALFAELCRLLHDRRLAVQVGAEGLTLAFFAADVRRGARVETSPGCAQDAAVRLATDDATILALAQGELDFGEAVLAERLWLAGQPVDVLAFFDALMLYFQAAVRTLAFPRLLRAWREERMGGETR